MLSRRHFLTFWLPLALGLTYACACFIWALSWVNRPYAGFLILPCHTAVLSSTPKGTGLSAGLHEGETIVGYDQQRLQNVAAFYDYVASRPSGTLIGYEVATGTQVRTLRIPSQLFTVQDWVGVFFTGCCLGLLHFAIGALVLWRKRDDPAAWAHWTACLAMGLFLIGLFDGTTDFHFADVPVLWCETMIGFTCANLALHLPRRWRLIREFPNASHWGLAIGVTVAGGLIAGAVHTQALIWYQLIDSVCCLGAMVIPASALWAWFSNSSSSQERRQARIILFGSVLAFLPAISLRYLIDLFGLDSGYLGMAILFEAVFPLAIAYAIVRHQLFDIQVVLRTAAVYTALVSCLGGLYVACATTTAIFLNPWLSQHAGTRLSGLLATLVVASLFQPLLTVLRRRLDRLFLGEPSVPLKLLADFPPPVSTSPGDLAAALVAMIDRQLGAAWVKIRLDDGTEVKHGDVPVYADTLADISESNRAVYLQEFVPVSDDVTLVINMATATDPLGTLLIGPRPSAIPYETDVRAMLGVLAGQTAVAIQGARLLQERVRLLVQEETARTQSQERDRVITEVVSSIRSDIRLIDAATTQFQQAPGDLSTLQAIRHRLEHIEGYLDETTKWVKDTPGPNAGRTGPRPESGE